MVFQQPESSSSLEFVHVNGLDQGSPLTTAVEITFGEPTRTASSAATSQAFDNANESCARDADGRLPNCSDDGTTPIGPLMPGRNQNLFTAPYVWNSPNHDRSVEETTEDEENEVQEEDEDGNNNDEEDPELNEDSSLLPRGRPLKSVTNAVFGRKEPPRPLS